ncbi:hypothetical protein ACFLWD_01260 [Chloroflexota bacterium]
MKQSERGYTVVEVIIAVTIIIFIVGAATMTTFQVFNATRNSNKHMTVVSQVQNAGYWISHDALMADGIVIDDEPGTEEFLTLTWAEWDFDEIEDTIYHSVTYSIQDLSSGIGKFVRTYSDGEVEEQTLVAEYIYYNPYYNPENPGDATWATYTYPVLTMQIAASFEDASEIREYEIWLRRDF